MTPERLGKYEIRGTLGQGAMGLVYDGWDPLILRRVAIKTVLLGPADDLDAAEAVQRFRREAQAAGRLQHPNIVSVFDFGETETLAYIVMEFMDGGTLKEFLDREKMLSPAVACDMMGRVLDALAYSHRAGVIHRDVKPGNVMLDQHGAVKLGDFGIARMESSSMTLVGDVLGTPAYMAPEQFLGETADARSDIFAAGATLFHLLTGTRPYEGSRSAVRQKVLTASEPPSAAARVAGMPAALDAVLGRAMARQPADRFQTAAEFNTAMRAALLTANDASADETAIITTPRSPPRPPATAPPPPPAAPRRRAPVAWLAGGALLLLAAAGMAAFLVRPTETPIRHDTVPPPPVLPVKRQMPVAPPLAEPKPPPPPLPSDAARAVGTAIANIDCALARVQPTLGGLSMSGLAGAGEPDERLHQAVAAAAGGLDTGWDGFRDIGRAFCGTLDAIRPAWQAGGMQLGLEVQHGTALEPPGTPLYTDMLIKPVAGGLDFPAYLRVDYVQNDGSVAHMYPTVATPAAPGYKAVPADPSRRLAAGAALVLGRGEHGKLMWTVGTPYGTDVIVAVASDTPLSLGRRANNEPAANYFDALGRAIEAATADGARVAAAAMPLETREKK